MLWIVPLLFLLFSCTSEYKMQKSFNCLDCHKKEASNTTHPFLSCRDCHQGKEPAKNKENAHQNLKTNLNLPEIENLCQKCHKREVQSFKQTIHYTYRRELTSIIEGFRLDIEAKEIFKLSQIEPNPNTPKGLLIDFLKRRCLSCHIFTQGEAYPKTKRSLGCLSCHLPHKLSKPEDEACLSCHYSTKIGWDYYGFFPHNWYADYRSPFIEGKYPERPYGIESYKLREDIHLTKGFKCITCHNKIEIMEGKNKLTCNDCHKQFKTKVFHKGEILRKVRCETCHANFIAQDEIKICYLEKELDLEKWLELAVQESSEIEEKILKSYNSNLPLTSRDKFTSKEYPGLWLCTLGNRTFDKIAYKFDHRKRLCIKRKEKIIIKFENLTLEGSWDLCKTPHSIGKGDINRSLEILNRYGFK